MIDRKNPSGAEEIIISGKNEKIEIFLDDRADGSREYNLDIFVRGENSVVSVKGRMDGKNKDKKKWNISLFLEGKNQSAILDLKGVAEEQSFIEFDGGGIIKTSSENGQIQVSEKIYLFSGNAKAKAIPVLRVETENVLSASHSASISPFNEELFFFLESRGIPREEGKYLLKKGILGE